MGDQALQIVDARNVPEEFNSGQSFHTAQDPDGELSAGKYVDADPAADMHVGSEMDAENAVPIQGSAPKDSARDSPEPLDIPAIDESSPGKESGRSPAKTKGKRGRGSGKRSKKKAEAVEETPVVESQPDDEAEEEPTPVVEAEVDPNEMPSPDLIAAASGRRRAAISATNRMSTDQKTKSRRGRKARTPKVFDEPESAPQKDDDIEEEVKAPEPDLPTSEKPSGKRSKSKRSETGKKSTRGRKSKSRAKAVVEDDDADEAPQPFDLGSPEKEESQNADQEEPVVPAQAEEAVEASPEQAADVEMQPENPDEEADDQII